MDNLKRHEISLLAFLTVSIFTLILLFNLNVYADDLPEVPDTYNCVIPVNSEGKIFYDDNVIDSNIFFDSNRLEDYSYYTYSNNLKSLFDGDMDNGFISFVTKDNSRNYLTYNYTYQNEQYNPLSFNYYIITYQQTNAGYIYFFNNPSCYISQFRSNNNSIIGMLCYPSELNQYNTVIPDDDDNLYLRLPFMKDGNTNNFYVGNGGVYAMANTNGRYYDYQVDNGNNIILSGVGGFGSYTFGAYDYYPLFTNIDVYSVNDSYDINNNGYIDRVAVESSRISDTNYTMSVEWLGNGDLINNYGSDDGDVTFPDGSGGTVQNNLYMKDASWNFNIPDYMDDYNTVKPNYTAVWGVGSVLFYGLINDFQEANSADYNLKFDFYVKISGKHYNSTNIDNKIGFAGSYALRDIEVSLDDFINNSYTQSWDISYIFDNAIDNNGNNVSSMVETMKNYTDIEDFTWVLYCNARLESGNYVSGTLQATYDFLSQEKKIVSDDIKDNKNPYYPNDENGNPVIPDSDSSNVITDGHGNITLTNYDNDNNNQTVNINSGVDGDTIVTLVDNINPSGDPPSLSSRIQEYVSSNQWFSVMAEAMPWLPGIQFINDYWLIFLGILCASFALWIIIHLT